MKTRLPPRFLALARAPLGGADEVVTGRDVVVVGEGRDPRRDLDRSAFGGERRKLVGQPGSDVARENRRASVPAVRQHDAERLLTHPSEYVALAHLRAKHVAHEVDDRVARGLTPRVVYKYNF